MARRGSDDPRAGVPEKNYITRAGHRRLTEEFDLLRFKKRAEIVAALADAAAEGDRSENAEYIYRKRQLRDADRRIRHLARRLDLAVIVDPSEQKRRDRVFFGAIVEIDDEDGARRTYRIVGADEIEPGGGTISWRSPAGRALLGKAVGDAVVVRIGDRARVLTVAAIRYE